MPYTRRSKSIPSGGPLTTAIKIPAKYNYENMMKKHHLKHASIQFRNDLLKSKSSASYHSKSVTSPKSNIRT